MFGKVPFLASEVRFPFINSSIISRAMDASLIWENRGIQLILMYRGGSSAKGAMALPSN